MRSARLPAGRGRLPCWALVPVAAALCLVAALPAHAQTVRWESVPLERALMEFADAAGVDLVFAHRLVSGRRVSGAWTPGDDPAVGLANLLQGTRLRAEQIRTRQFVIIAEPLNIAVEPGDPAAYTGRLEGFVIDADTGLPLEGAHVLLVDLQLGGIVGWDGSFVVSGLPTGRYTVQFSYVGYRSVRVQMDVYPETSLLPPTIRLRPEPFMLAGAVVRPRSEPSPGAGATDLLSGLSPSARQASALPPSAATGDILQILDWLPGVTHAPGGGAALAVRGFDPSFLRVYRDGAPVIEPAGPSGVSGLFQLEALRAVRLHRGTPPAELGGGTAGVLEVEPEDGRGRSRSTGVAAAGPLVARFAVTGPVSDRVGLSLAARHSFPWRGYPLDPVADVTNGATVIDPIGGPGRAEEGAEQVGLAYFDGEGNVSVGFSDRQRTSFGGWIAGDHVDIEGSTDAHGRRATGVMSVRHRALVGETFFAGTAYLSRYAADEAVRDSATRLRTYEVGLAEAGLRLEADQFFSFDHTLRAGLSLARRSLRAELEVRATVDSADAAVTEMGFWLQDIWRPWDGLQVETGVRAETFGGRLYASPLLLARRTVVPDRVYARLGAGRQLEGLIRLPDPGSAMPARLTARWLLAGPDAPPVSVWQAGAGLESMPLPWLAISADVFARRASNLPEPRPGVLRASDVVSADSIRARYNRVAGRAAGVELAARAESGDWLIGTTYTISRASVQEATIEGDELWRRARHDRTHAMGLVIQHETSRWRGSARLDVTSRPPTGRGGVVRLDIAAAYRFVAAGAQWMVQVQAQPTAIASRPPVATGGVDASDDPHPLAFYADGATLPAWPTFTVQASW